MRVRKVGVVVQRFGDELVGGAEGHARAIALVLARQHDVTVLTSCARDASTWAMDEAPGTTMHSGLRVVRFAHPVRNADGRARVPLRHKLRMLLHTIFDLTGRDRVARAVGQDAADGHAYLRRQGPCCPELVNALATDAFGFDAVVFMTALFHPTAEGLPACASPSVLVPTLHDEKPMYMPWYREVFSRADEVLYNTATERRLARRLYGDQVPQGQVVGVGVPLLSVTAEAVADARQRHGLPARYVVYVGRIEKGKGCGDLLRGWARRGPQNADAALVFVGKGRLPVAGVPGVHALGFLSAADRDAVVAGSVAMVVPSRLESLSLVLLEAMALGVPVVANAASPVLADHMRASGAGAAYRGVRQLAAALRAALARTADERAALGAAGRAYVQANYVPARIEQAWLDAVERVCKD